MIFTQKRRLQDRNDCLLHRAGQCHLRVRVSKHQGCEQFKESLFLKNSTAKLHVVAEHTEQMLRSGAYCRVERESVGPLVRCVQGDTKEFMDTAISMLDGGVDSISVGVEMLSAER